MRFNRKAVAVSMLAVMVAALVVNVVTAIASPVLAVKQLKWRDTLGQAVASLPADTTFQTDEADTVRTYPIDTYDWDWSMFSGGGAALAHAKIMFVSSTLTSNGVTDTLYFNVEKGTGQDSVYAYNGSIAATLGYCAVAENATVMGNVWVGNLLVDTDTPGVNNIWLTPSFRIRVAGDQSGSTPKISGLKAYIIYPRRAEAQ